MQTSGNIAVEVEGVYYGRWKLKKRILISKQLDTGQAKKGDVVMEYRFRQLVWLLIVMNLIVCNWCCRAEHRQPGTVLEHKAGSCEQKLFRVGMIGLDTSHVIAFTKHMNNPKNNYGCKVVVGYSGGSPDIPTSADRVEKYTERMRDEFGVEIVESIEELCAKVDGVMLMSVDGRPHLKQIKPVIAAHKPVYIDKPMAGTLEDVIEIFRLAKENNVPCWSSSSLRYCPGIIGMRNNEDVGDILGCDAFSPCALEQHHPDLYWYGVHGMEILYTIMGPGCETVQRVHTKDTDFVVGVWKDGRIGTFRGTRSGKHDYGAMVFGTKSVTRSGGYTSYKPLVNEIIRFFKTGEVPIPPEETTEMFAFMSAADESKVQDGAVVSIKSVIEKAEMKNKMRSCKKN